jgi:hypothetical protein
MFWRALHPTGLLLTNQSGQKLREALTKKGGHLAMTAFLQT